MPLQTAQALGRWLRPSFLINGSIRSKKACVLYSLIADKMLDKVAKIVYIFRQMPFRLYCQQAFLAGIQNKLKIL